MRCAPKRGTASTAPTQAVPRGTTSTPIQALSYARPHILTSFDDALSGKPIVVARSRKRLVEKQSMRKPQQQGDCAGLNAWSHHHHGRVNVTN
jgi:hypothetical protein